MRTFLSILTGIAGLLVLAGCGDRPPAEIRRVDLSGLPAIIDPTSVTVDQAVIERGQRVYTQTCLACHMADGRGMPRMQPPLVGSERVSGDPYTLIYWILKGSAANYGQPSEWAVKMLSHEHLSDADIAAVTSYVRSAFGGGASGVSPEMVRLVREQ